MLFIGDLLISVTCEDKKPPRLVVQGKPFGVAQDVTRGDLTRLADFLMKKAATLPGDSAQREG